MNVTVQVPTTPTTSGPASTTSPTTLDGNASAAACLSPCQNGGNCTSGLGVPTCNCPPGYNGDVCESIKEERCGMYTCYHGSQCVTASNGDLYCDCSTINDPTKHYAGNFCQYEATLYCPNRKNFCFNGGRCKEEGDGTFSCLCPDEWVGPSCDFESQQIPNDEVEKDESCDKSCLNGGNCRNGAQKMSSVEGITPDVETLVNDTSSQRCVCPQGYTGPRCEHAYEECGNGEHMCLHGSKCIPPKDANHLWTCECDESSGSACNRHRSVECTSPDTQKGVYRGLESLMLCVNDGVCTTYQQNGRVLPACKCPPMYTGPHCEFIRGDFNESDSMIVTSHQSAVGLIIGLLVSCVLIIFVGLMIYRKKSRQTNRRKSAMIEFAHIHGKGERPPSRDEVDFEDTMEEVELL